ncbi:transmembrane protein, putative (macronuclear) [Tetrahymena thermophila SB210]|uniref:Transmembrane protein, putative n=1 Tax=Tetrahymena thermophila (strain SB210) TaxID=312017 RepID=W7X3C7_TETTS|nr:transmembrane protein, putative [Tetrahymena thermophila SB210]EWS70928.1 transmembrane protein, putative [Tetrahymena thermophila SB210]|eukprot:XP_012656543.1 transmembrane protein, putative [Tetrahymena thermophila SB210]
MQDVLKMYFYKKFRISYTNSIRNSTIKQSSNIFISAVQNVQMIKKGLKRIGLLQEQAYFLKFENNYQIYIKDSAYLHTYIYTYIHTENELVIGIGCVNQTIFNKKEIFEIYIQKLVNCEIHLLFVQLLINQLIHFFFMFGYPLLTALHLFIFIFIYIFHNKCIFQYICIRFNFIFTK